VIERTEWKRLLGNPDIFGKIDIKRALACHKGASCIKLALDTV
jgi:hypothetical protein